jgi:hypothetical protein
MMNCNHFQLAMLAYNLNCWLMLFNREEGSKVATLQHTMLATARRRVLFLAAKIWRHRRGQPPPIPHLRSVRLPTVLEREYGIALVYGDEEVDATAAGARTAGLLRSMRAHRCCAYVRPGFQPVYEPMEVLRECGESSSNRVTRWAYSQTEG